MLFTTETGSRYELDTENQRIRRLSGSADPTPRQGSDGEWKKYLSVTNPEVNAPVLIVWDIEAGVARCTETSHVTHVH